MTQDRIQIGDVQLHQSKTVDVGFRDREGVARIDRHRTDGGYGRVAITRSGASMDCASVKHVDDAKEFH